MLEFITCFGKDFEEALVSGHIFLGLHGGDTRPENIPKIIDERNEVVPVWRKTGGDVFVKTTDHCCLVPGEFVLILAEVPPVIHADRSFVGSRNVTAEGTRPSGVGTESKNYIEE